MFKIGDFSKLCQVPVKTLRYYDEIGLLRPEQVDNFTGYRYYAAHQLERLNRILALKDLGLSLEQIHLMLEHDLPADQLRGMLRLKQSELAEEVNETRACLARVEARLKQIEQEQKMPDYEITIKKLNHLRVASVRGVVPKYSEQSELWCELAEAIRKHNIQPTGPCFAMYHDPGYVEQYPDTETCYPVNADLMQDGRFKVYDLPNGEFACIIHKGPFNTLTIALSALLKWIEDNGYRIIGPNREIYLFTGEGPVRQDDPSYVTENQFPVAKI